MIAAAHIVQAKRKADAAEPGRQGAAGRQEEAAQRGEADARKGAVRLMYDFKIEAADKATMYRDLAVGARRTDRGRARPDRQHGQCRGLDLGDAAGPQLGGLLSQCGRRAGAWAVPGPSGLHPHPVRPGRVRSGRGDAAGPARRRRACLPRPHRLRRRFGERAGRAHRDRDGKLIAVLDLDSPTPARFTEEDEAGCVALCDLLAKVL